MNQKAHCGTLEEREGAVTLRARAWLCAVALFVMPACAWAQGTDPHCGYKDIPPADWDVKELANPPNISSKDGILHTVLSVKYTDPRTTKIGGCPVTLRTYNGQLVGPTLRVKPGEALQPLLVNDLPVESPAEVLRQFDQESADAHIVTRPASFNTTNLHTHGLHVSPSGNSDNVLLAIAPATKHQYDVKLPPHHTRGTYWYHAHSHGSTSIQVGSGMAGALIVEDDPGNIPKPLADANKLEKVMVIQALLYNKQGRLDNIGALFPDPGTTPDDCRPGQQQDLATWQCSKRRITINGQIMPTITMRRGEVQRWRIVNASFRESILLSIEGHDLNEIATDGLYTGRVDVWPASGLPLDLEPGYRTDVLVEAGDKAGNFNVLDAPSAPGTGLLGGSEPRNVIATIRVIDEALTPAMQLPTSADMAPLNPFAGVDLSTSAMGVQSVIFKIGSDLKHSSKNYFQVNNQSFDPAHERILKLNTTEMWTLTTVGDPPEVVKVIGSKALGPLPHVFHIHVNPFQMQRAGPDGLPQTVWKDTLLVPPGATIPIYTRYTEFTGRFVMHCHILDHEDLGMMEVINITEDGLGEGMGHTSTQKTPPAPR